MGQRVPARFQLSVPTWTGDRGRQKCLQQEGRLWQTVELCLHASIPEPRWADRVLVGRDQQGRNRMVSNLLKQWAGGWFPESVFSICAGPWMAILLLPLQPEMPIFLLVNNRISRTLWRRYGHDDVHLWLLHPRGNHNFLCCAQGSSMEIYCLQDDRLWLPISKCLKKLSVLHLKSLGTDRWGLVITGEGHLGSQKGTKTHLLSAEDIILSL